jgi:putative spermidine/putrescine transport system substrate-binding protein
MDIKRMRRRDVVSLLGGAAAVGVAGPASPKPSPPSRRSWSSHSGGSMGTAMRKAFFAGYEEVRHPRGRDEPADFGKLRAGMVDSNNVEWDVTEIGGQDAIRAVKLGLVGRSTADRRPREISADRAQPYVFASSVYTTIIGYRRPSSRRHAAQSWADWWDARSSGARSVRNHPTANLEFALIADGVPKDKVYPIDFDRAFKKLDQIKPHVTAWWSTGQQPAQLLLDKEVVLATGWNGRFYDVIKKARRSRSNGTRARLSRAASSSPRAPRALLGEQDAGRDVRAGLEAIYATELRLSGLNSDR